VAGWPEGGCVGCSMMADQVAHLAHLNAWHGTNAFRREGDRIFRTYLIDSRGDEGLGSVWSYLDMTALGRQEAWEDSPEGYPQTEPYRWWRLHDEYGDHDRPVRNGRNEELRPTIDEHAGGAAG
jgi:predicted dithiol-disulfide oxidoreductase (DUF899 family)